ncbi:hypothetical protein [Gryllotalpicola ginsengisoli]|uniref:hypothetical protein n=1 Tax=Gryllotalpicola ginsengisoli TaxID=444608 RepID=UPI0003B79C6D|nr:hypothetical protein [Gryllotalpicola ginsengisoli]
MTDSDDTVPFDPENDQPLEDDEVFDDDLPDELPRATPAGSAAELDETPDDLPEETDDAGYGVNPEQDPSRPRPDHSPDTEEDTVSGGPAD